VGTSFSFIQSYFEEYEHVAEEMGEQDKGNQQHRE
jgi:hypothetical protein